LVDARTRLRAPADADAAPLFAVIDRNRAHLRRWLPWVDGVIEPADTANFVRGANERIASGRALELLIEHAGELAGVAGYRALDPVNRRGEIGYWLSADLGGRGIMTAACRALIVHGFDRLDLNRIAIAAATDNWRSRGIPERLGFRFEGVLRQPEWLYDHFVDHAVYSLLRAERDERALP
jgi:ribosomal-protein-serine acetyltransferase